MRWLRLIVGVAALAALLSGCVQTTAGTARPGPDECGQALAYQLGVAQ